MRPLLSWRNWLDVAGVTLAVDSVSAGFAGSSLTIPQISAEVWRATYAGATRNIRLDFGTAREIGAIALGLPRDGVKPLQSDSVRIRLSQTAVDGTDVLDTGAMSFDAGLYSTWCYPLAAGIRPNLIVNHSLRDNATGWTGSGTTPPTTLVSASTVNALRDIGGGYATRASMVNGNVMDVYSSSVPAAPGPMIFSARVASTLLTASMVVQFYNAGAGFIEGAVGSVVQPRTGQWKTQPSEWAQTTLQYTAPAGTASVVVGIRGTASATVSNPALHWAEVMAGVADGSGEMPIFSGHYYAQKANILSLDAVAFARYVTISITSAQAYLDIGRAWVGPAFVASYGPDSETAGIADAGENVRAQISALRFAARGQPMRNRSVQWPILTEAEADRLEIAAEEACETGQVLVVRDVLRARKTSIIGALTQPPAPTRGYPLYWKAAMAVQEDM